MVANRNRKPVRKAADSSGPERRLARAINQGFGILDAGAMTAHAQSAIARGPEAFIDALPWEDFTDHLTETALPAIQDPAIKAARLEVGHINAGTSLNAIDDLSRRYAQQQAGQLIVNISNAQRETIRGVLGEAFSGNLTKDQAARRIRQGIGLHPRWAQAVITFEEKQLARPRPKGYSQERWEAQARKRARTYHDRLLRKRADNIARTEIQTAENLGRYATWTDSIAKGINGADSRKEWAPGPNACEQCTAMAGEIVRWDAPFSNGNLMPPAHVNCRCVANLLPAPYKNPINNPRPIRWTDPLGHRMEIDTDRYEDGYRLLDNPTIVKPPTPEEMIAARTAATKADDFTLETTMHWSEEKLMDQIGKYADDPEVVDRLLDIIDQRAAIQAAKEARDLAAQAAYRDELAAFEAKQKLRELELNQRKAPGPYPKNDDPVTNPAARPERKLNARQRNEEEYQQYLGAQMQRAENELSVLLNNANLAEARKKGIDIYQLFTGPYHVAQKYASEELKDWWLVNGRETLGSWRYKAFHRPTDKVHADRVRSLGHESGQARNNREYGL